MPHEELTFTQLKDIYNILTITLTKKSSTSLRYTLKKFDKCAFKLL